MERNFRSLYVAALAVIAVGLLGSVLTSRAHADTWKEQTAVKLNEPAAGVPKIVRAWFHSAPQQQIGDPVNPAIKRSPDTVMSNVLTGLLGIGFLSLSGIISLFLKKSA